MMLPGAYELFRNLHDSTSKRNPRLLANFLLTEVYTFLKEQKLSYDQLPIPVEFVGECVDLLQGNRITEGVAFDLLHLRASGDRRPASEIVRHNRWTKADEEAVILQLVQEAITLEPYYSTVYGKKGKTFALNQILLRLDVIGRKSVSRTAAKLVIDRLLRNSTDDPEHGPSKPVEPEVKNE
jgi:Asp-tRNA(Asn)/Glu-tRNA(Gln) amidotransferase B subunit